MVWNNCWRNLIQNAIDWCLHNNHTHAQITVFHSVHGVCYSSSWASRCPLRIPPKDRLYWCFFSSQKFLKGIPKALGVIINTEKEKLCMYFLMSPILHERFSWMFCLLSSCDMELSSLVGIQHLFSLARKNTNAVWKERCLVCSSDT